MTREEAIKYGIEWLEDEYLDANDGEFIKISLEALEQESKTDVVDKIRAEIEQYIDKEKLNFGGQFDRGLNLALKIIDKYKAESQGHWIFKDADDQACSIYTYNKCGEQITIFDDTIKSPQEGHYNFCPNCGDRKMVDSQESEG